jgi:hypothetical protein
MSEIVKWTTTVIFISCIIFIIFKTREDEESNYTLKIIGYYLLGAFRFSLNKLHIPLGFIIYLLILRNAEKNQGGKRYAAILGFVAFVTALIIPVISQSYYERTRYVELGTANIYEFHFQEHWKQTAEALDMDEESLATSRVEDLNIDYEKNGKIKRFRYEVTWREEGELRHASVNLDEGQKRISVRAIKISEWLQYDRIIDARRLFAQLDKINIKEITPETDFSYYGFVFGGWDNFGIRDEKTFIIEDDRFVPFKGEIPVEGYWIQTFGMVQTSDHSYSSTDPHYYLFDVQQGDK